MHIRYYRTNVQNSLEDWASVLEHIEGLDLARRERPVNQKPVVLEYCHRQDDGSYDLVFTVRRMANGPGRAHRGSETVDFDLEGDDGFGEQTVAVWKDDRIAVQYNHYGVRPGGVRVYMQHMLQHLDRDEDAHVEMHEVIDDGAYARFLHAEAHTRLEFTVDADAVTPEMARENVGLKAALELQQATAAARVKVSLSYGESRAGGSLHNAAEAVAGIVASGAARNVTAGVKEAADLRGEILNLLGHQEAEEVEQREVDRLMTLGRRLDYIRVIELIRRRFLRWLQRRQ